MDADSFATVAAVSDYSHNPGRTTHPDLLVLAVVYVSLDCAALIVGRGDTARFALILPYLAGIVPLRLHHPA